MSCIYVQRYAEKFPFCFSLTSSYGFYYLENFFFENVILKFYF